MKTTEPPRLLDAGSSIPEELRSNLEAGLGDFPGDDVLARLAARLPLAGPLPPDSPGPRRPDPQNPGPSGPPTSPPTPVVPAASATSAALASLASVLPFAGIGAALAIVVLVVINRPQETPAAPVSAVELPSAAVARDARRDQPSPQASSGARDVTMGGDPPSPQVQPAPSPAQALPSSAASGESEDEREIHLLQHAQDALSGSPSEALDLAGQHGARFPRGRLTQEREVIAITALVRLGRMVEARARAAAFASRFPHSAHLRRIQAMVEPKDPNRPSDVAR